MKYLVLTADYINQLEEEVNRHLSSGWVLQGGVSISRSRSKSKGGADDLVYAQAMIKVNP